MPQADAGTIQEVADFLGTVDNFRACKYLQDHGYTLTDDWEWCKSGIKSYGDMTRQEFACLKYLCHEWDYGGLANG